MMNLHRICSYYLGKRSIIEMFLLISSIVSTFSVCRISSLWLDTSAEFQSWNLLYVKLFFSVTFLNVSFWNCWGNVCRLRETFDIFDLALTGKICNSQNSGILWIGWYQTLTLTRTHTNPRHHLMQTHCVSYMYANNLWVTSN